MKKKIHALINVKEITSANASTFQDLETNETKDNFIENENYEIYAAPEVEFEGTEVENSCIDNEAYICEKENKTEEKDNEIKENANMDLPCFEISPKKNHDNFKCEMCGECFESKEEHRRHNAEFHEDIISGDKQRFKYMKSKIGGHF